MPTVLRIGSFRFHFYAGEWNEPAHIHVDAPTGECKFWLDKVRLVWNKGIPKHDVRVIQRLVVEHRDFLKRKYDERPRG
jgi:hypothetical protein